MRRAIKTVLLEGHLNFASCFTITSLFDEKKLTAIFYGNHPVDLVFVMFVKFFSSTGTGI